MQSMSVRPEQVTALAGEIRSGATNIKSQLDNLEQKVSTLRSQWSGEAQASYDQAQRAWTASLTELQQLLGQIAGKTEEISSGYLHTDAKAASRFGG